MVISACLYGIAILLLLDRALLLLSNTLFIIGFYILVGFKETVFFFGRRIKGSIAMFFGLFFIAINLKLLGVLFQLYGVWEFFKAKVVGMLTYFEFIPFLGNYIKQLKDNTTIKKNDDDNKV